MRFGDSSFGFGGWDKGTWGLGVGLTFMRFGANSLGFGGWDKGT